jgi:hypothetical protein
MPSDPELRDLKVEWQRGGMGPQDDLLVISQTHGDGTTTTLYLTRRQAKRVADEANNATDR